MQEKILNTRKNGMAVMLLCILLYVAAILCVVFGAIRTGESGLVLGGGMELRLPLEMSPGEGPLVELSWGIGRAHV